MKTNKTMRLAAATIAVLSFASNLSAQEPVWLDKAPINRAVLASPRAMEVFPWLARGMASGAERKTECAKLNRALISSPRVLEQFPELARASRSNAEQLIRASIPANVLKNKALKASPRVLEEFPELARQRSILERAAEFHVAPLK